MLVAYVGSVQYQSPRGQFSVVWVFFCVTRTVVLPPHTCTPYSHLGLRHSAVCSYCAAMAVQRCFNRGISNPFHCLCFSNTPAPADAPGSGADTPSLGTFWQQVEPAGHEHRAVNKAKNTRKKIFSSYCAWKYDHPRAGMVFSLSISLMFCTSLNLYPCFWIVLLCYVINQFLKEGPNFQKLIQKGDL